MARREISDILATESWSQKQQRMLASGGVPTKSGNDNNTVMGWDWFRGDYLNYFPTAANLAEPAALYDYFLDGLVPEQPFITKEQNVLAFGSCFAEYIRLYLQEHGYAAYTAHRGTRVVPVIHYGEGLNNTFTLLQQFEWVWGNKQISEGLWIDKDKKYIIPTEEGRLATKEIFDRTDVFILTLGLSEIWYDKVTGEVFWRGITKDMYDPKRHGFRVSTVEENTQNLYKIYDFIKRNRPDAKIIVTLSPVPLYATFRDIPCTAASTVSKAILRVAADNLYTKFPDVYYWPSYEIVNLLGRYDADNRHVSEETRTVILNAFHKYFLCA
jgi:hypothetical protein